MWQSLQYMIGYINQSKIMSTSDLTLVGVGVILAEIVFWVVLTKWVYNKRKAKKSIWLKEP